MQPPEGGTHLDMVPGLKFSSLFNTHHTVPTVRVDYLNATAVSARVRHFGPLKVPVRKSTNDIDTCTERERAQKSSQWGQNGYPDTKEKALQVRYEWTK